MRASALENNLRLYTLINGTRRTLASARVTAPKLGAWHTLRVTATGPRIQAWLDGAALLDHKDTTYTRGFIRLWTKADSAVALKGLSPAVIGMTTVTLVQMLPHAVVDVLTALLLVGTVAAMVARGVGPLPVLAAGAVVGVLATLVLRAR